LPTLEERVTRLERDMDEQKRLRASQDSDLSDLGQKLNAQQKLIQAIAKTQSEHTATLAGHTATLADHTATLADHTATLAEHTQRLDRLEGKVDNLQGGVEQIIGMLDTLIESDRER
jgi:ABC-type transporter Mla subunit MlaD